MPTDCNSNNLMKTMADKTTLISMLSNTRLNFSQDCNKDINKVIQLYMELVQQY